MYDSDSVETGLSDIGACRYDGVEIGLEKLLDAGVGNVEEWLATYDLELYCVMSPWLESETAVESVVENADRIADLGAEYLGLLPPQRGNQDDETLESWLERIADAIEYVHLKDVDPVAEFTRHRDALSTGDFHLDDVVNYFRTFTDLGDGLLDFEAVAERLDGVGYDGHVTIEVENETDRPLVHAGGDYRNTFVGVFAGS